MSEKATVVKKAKKAPRTRCRDCKRWFQPGFTVDYCPSCSARRAERGQWFVLP